MTVPPFRPPVPEPLHPFGAYRPPGEFSVTSPYGQRTRNGRIEWHRALDMGNGRLGAPITSPAPGTVIAEGYLRQPWSEPTDAFGTGNWGGIMVAIDHGDDWFSALAHMADTIVSVGQRVLDGQLLGHLGETGSAKLGGGHVHWDLYHGRPTAAMTYAQRQALTRDPWPLLRQNYRLSDTSTSQPAEDTMRFSGSELHIVDGTPTFRLTVNSNFRAGPTKESDSLDVFAAGTVVRAAWSVDGQSLDGNDDWLLTAMYVKTAFVTGYFHSSVVEPVETPAADCAPAVAQATQEATAAANKRWRDWVASAPH